MFTQEFIVCIVERFRDKIGEIDKFFEQAQKAFRLIKNRSLYMGIEI
ncbi:hypothetical protein CaldiYA01_22280 [Caldicellulosiruptor diazotrophicus]|uniref:Uncharacterized protein n=1 Tax=Caldicellulosiruptor diazotrophicus TaxID=2806205 RepID=A0ABM7NQ98_9FIRM|nr:hypothetical protein CaldiYA01_22280 [Caldicellulosiruptor diazotrophicus]